MSLFDLVGTVIQVAVVCFVGRAVWRWWQRQDAWDPDDPDTTFLAQDGSRIDVRVSTTLPSWRDYFELPAPVNGVITMSVTPSLPLSGVSEFVTNLQPALNSGLVVCVVQGHSPFLPEIGLAAKRAGYVVDWAKGNGYGAGGLFIYHPAVRAGVSVQASP